MNALKPKKKETKPRPKARAGQTPAASVGSDLERLFEPGVWKAELQELSKRDFDTFDQALESVAEIMMDRLHTEAANREEEKEFLLTLFKTDPHLCALLRSSLRVRG